MEGYGNVLEPMNRLSSRFHQVFDPLETSCFRCWGQGTRTDYALEIQRRGEGALQWPAVAI